MAHRMLLKGGHVITVGPKLGDIRAPIGHYAIMDDIADAAIFMLDNRSVAGTELRVDGGWSLPV